MLGWSLMWGPWMMVWECSLLRSEEEGALEVRIFDEESGGRGLGLVILIEKWKCRLFVQVGSGSNWAVAVGRIA